MKKLSKDKKNEIDRIVEFVKEGELLLKSQNYDNFGRLLHESWLRKKSLSNKITNLSIDDIYNKAIEKGALGGKLLGAGGGGFLLLYVPKYKQKRFLKNFSKLVHIPFDFENAGSKIIFKHNNK